MPKILVIFLFIISAPVYAKSLPDSELAQEREFEEALKTVEKSKEEREQFKDNSQDRGIASEEDMDPGFQKDFDLMMEDIDK